MFDVEKVLFISLCIAKNGSDLQTPMGFCRKKNPVSGGAFFPVRGASNFTRNDAKALRETLILAGVFWSARKDARAFEG